MNLSIAGWFLGGFLVGVGTKMGNGCTSGHGVCGIPRLSIRSIIATCTFMATGIAMATLRYYVPFFHNGKYFGDTYYNAYHWVFLGVFIVLMLGFVGLLVANFQMEWVHNYLFGFIFGFGLVLSGMCRISKIQSFLVMNENWDPTLMFVMASAVAINLVTFHFILNKDTPLKSDKFSVPNRNAKPDLRLFLGAAIFGCGWGMSGLCPGPGLVNMFHLTHALFWVISLAIGQISYEYLNKKLVDSQAAKNKQA